MKIVVACILLAFAVSSTSASCYASPVETVDYKWSNDVMHYCVYNGTKLLPGSRIINADTCERCTCSVSGLVCCGIGYFAGIGRIEGCTVVPDHCKAVVLNMDQTALCHE